MSKYPRVLVGCPTSKHKEYFLDRYVEALKKLDFPGLDFLIVDNSGDDGVYAKKIIDAGLPAVTVERGANSREAVANSMNYLRRKVLDEGYDYLMVIEQDLIPPIDIVQRLMKHGKEVCGAIYNIGFVNSKAQPPRPCLFEKYHDNEENAWKTRNLDPKKGFSYLGTGLREIHGMGNGCILIHRSILDKYGFWYMPQDTDKKRHPDVFFFLRLDNDGIKVFVDTTEMIPHFPKPWEDVIDW